MFQCLLTNHRKRRERTKKLVGLSPKTPTVDLTATSNSYPMSVYITNDELVVTKEPIETDKP